jgi:hypothetical protein
MHELTISKINMVSEKVLEDDYCIVNEGRSWTFKGCHTPVVGVRRGLNLP